MADTNSDLDHANKRGVTAPYGYKSDKGELFKVYLTAEVAIRGNFPPYAAGGNTILAGPIPKRLKMRNVKMVRINEDGRKERHKQPMATNAETLYTNGSELTNYDEEANWRVTSRRGESGKVGIRKKPA